MYGGGYFDPTANLPFYGVNRAAYAPPTYGPPTYGPPAYGPPAYGPHAYGPPAYGPPAYAQPGYAQPTYAQPDYAQPVHAQPTPVNAQHIYAQPPAGNTQPAYAQPAATNTQPAAAYAQPAAAYAQPAAANAPPASSNAQPASANVPPTPASAQPVCAQPAQGQAAPGLMVVVPAKQNLVIVAEELKAQTAGTAKTLMVSLGVMLFLTGISFIGLLLFRGADLTDTREESDMSDEAGPPVTMPPLMPEVPRTTVTTPLPKGVQKLEILLCTYGWRTREDAVMAPDGLCDYAFFDSLYRSEAYSLLNRTEYEFEPDLRTFMRAATRYSTTQLGVAFTFGRITRATLDLEEANTGVLAEFWDTKIFHVGILDTYEVVTVSEMVAAVSFLKVHENWQSAPLRHLSASLQHHQSVSWRETVQGNHIPSTIHDSFCPEKLGYYPDFFVVYGHYPFGDNAVDNGVIMPPTRLSAVHLPGEFFAEYPYDLSTGPLSLRYFYAKNTPSQGLVSVTMQGRKTTASPGEPLDFYSRCQRLPHLPAFGRYMEVCNDKDYLNNLQYKAKHYAMLTYHPTWRRVFTYDNEEGLCSKLCMVKDQVPDVRFGIAVYDVDYDDYANECASLNKFGAHSRLKTLRKIVDFWRNVTSHDFDEASCISIVE